MGVLSFFQSSYENNGELKISGCRKVYFKYSNFKHCTENTMLHWSSGGISQSESNFGEESETKCTFFFHVYSLPTYLPCTGLYWSRACFRIQSTNMWMQCSSLPLSVNFNPACHCTMNYNPTCHSTIKPFIHPCDLWPYPDRLDPHPHPLNHTHIT